MAMHSPKHPARIKTGAIRYLQDFSQDPDTRPEIAQAVQNLLGVLEHGVHLSASDREIIDGYASHAPWDWMASAAMSILMDLLEDAHGGKGVEESPSLGRTSFARRSEAGVLVDLGVIRRSCQEAIAGKPLDGSIPRVTISADALLAVAVYVQQLQQEIHRVIPAGFVLQGIARRGPMVTGSAANDVDGEVVYPFLGYPLQSVAAPFLGMSSSEPETHGSSDPVDMILEDRHCAVLSLMEQEEREASVELSEAVRAGIAVLHQGAPCLAKDHRAILTRYLAIVPRVLRGIGEDRHHGEDGHHIDRYRIAETYRGISSVRALLRAVDIALGNALPRWTPGRGQALRVWSSLRASTLGPDMSYALDRALFAAHDGLDLSDRDRARLEEYLRNADVVRRRQIWAVNLRSLLAAIPLRSEAERTARAYKFRLFARASKDVNSPHYYHCETCSRHLRRHYSLSREHRCDPIDHEISDVDLREARLLAHRIPTMSDRSRVVLWRISAVDRATGQGLLAREIDTGLASLDTLGHVAPPALQAVRAWLADKGQHRDGSDAARIALQMLASALPAQGSDRLPSPTSE